MIYEPLMPFTYPSEMEKCLGSSGFY